ncbi:MAG: helix-turn-helix domain-containing protein, partial [Planctomycetaceae bacterium]
MTAPWRAFSEGEAEELWVWLYPDGVRDALGVEPNACRNRWQPWLPTGKQHFRVDSCGAIFQSGGTETVCRGLAELLGEPKLRLVPNQRPSSLGEWRKRFQQSLSQATASRVKRTAQRLHRQLCGMTALELDRLTKVDEALQKLLCGPAPARGDLGRLACEFGFCDQSYLIRSVRQATGSSPTELRQGVDGSRSFWSYLGLYTPS